MRADENLRWQGLLGEARRIKLRNRFDMFLTATVGGALVVVAAAVWFLVTAADRLDVFDPPLVKPVADHRKLQNVYDRVPHGIAGFDEKSGQLLVPQPGLKLHRWDPRTEIWRSDDLSALHVAGEFTAAHSSCPRGQQTCDDWHQLWLSTSEQGLVRRDADGWHVSFSGSRFIGVDGLPVQQEDLEQFAIGGGQLLALTGNKGFGAYNQETGAWSDPLPRAWATRSLSDAAYWNGRFWVGTNAGLYSVDVDRTVSASLEQRDEIIDLDAALQPPRSDLAVLSERMCSPPEPTTCRSLVSRAEGGTTRSLMLEAQRPLFGSHELSFAQHQGRAGYLFAGDAGVLRYDPVLHGWSQIVSDDVNATLRDGAGFYFATEAEAGVVEGGAVARRWQLTEPVVDLKSHVDFTYALGQETSSVSALVSGQTDPLENLRSEDLSFDTEDVVHAVGSGEFAMIVASNGAAAIHNLASRSYSRMNKVAGWMSQPSAETVSAGRVYFVNRASGMIRHLDLGMVARGEANPEGSVQIDSPLTVVKPWQDRIALQDSSSQVVTVGTATKTHIGPAAQKVAGDFVDVFAADGQLYAATTEASGVYYYGSRRWSEYSPFDNDPVRRYAKVGTQVWAISRAGKAVNLNEPTQMLGDYALDVTDNTLSDALADGRILFLAGGSKIAAYDLQARRVQRAFSVPPGQVQLLAVPNGIPLSQSQGRLIYGENPLTGADGAVRTAWYDAGRAWALRQAGNDRYLSHHGLGGLDAPQCLLRTPRAPTTGSALIDAIEVGPDLFAVLTNSGLVFYHSGHRSWYPGVVGNGGQNDRLGLIENELLWFQPDQAGQLRRVDLGSIDAEIQSCSPTLAPRKFKSENAVSAAFDPAAQRLVALRVDGEVVDLRAKNATLLEEASAAPLFSELRRVYGPSGQHLEFISSDAYFRYSLANHGWSRFPFYIGGRAVNVDDAVVTGKFITARAGQSHFLGTVDRKLNRVALVRIGDRIAGYGQSTRLTDAVSLDDAKWTFVYEDSVRTFDPKTKKWATRVAFPRHPSPQVIDVPGRMVVQRSMGAKDVLLVPRAGTAGSSTPDFLSLELPADRSATWLTDRGSVIILRNRGETPQICHQQGNRFLPCKELAQAPLTIEPSRIEAVYALDDEKDIYQTDTGLVLVDVRDGAGRPVTGVPSGQRLATVVKQAEGMLLQFTNGVTGRIDGDANFLQFAEVGALGTDGRGQPVISDGRNFWAVVGRAPARVSPTDRLVGFSPQLGFWQIFDDGSIKASTIGQDLSVSHILDYADIEGVFPVADRLWLTTADELLELDYQDCSDSQCPTIANRYSLNMSIYSVQERNGTIVATDTKGLQYRIAKGSLSRPIEAAVDANTPDIRSQRVSQWRETGNGQVQVNPVLDIRIVDQTGTLHVVRASGSSSLGVGGVKIDHVAPALGSSWFKWNRQRSLFEVAASNGLVDFSADRFLASGRFAFGKEGALVVTSSVVYKATEEGVWRFADARLPLTDVRFSPVGLGTDIVAGHGYFVGSSGTSDLNGNPVPTLATSHAASIGAFRILENRRAGGLRIQTSGRRAVSSAGRGMPWDRRQSVGFHNGELFVATDVGLVNRDLSNHLPLPSRRCDLVSHGSSALHCLDDKWHRLGPNGAWVDLPQRYDIGQDVIANNAVWRWRREAGGISVTLNDRPGVELLRRPATGMHFSRDILREAGGVNGQVVLLTDQFTEVLDAASGNTVALQRPQAAEQLGVFRPRPGDAGLFLRQAGKVFRWQSQSRSFQAVNYDPAIRRLLVDRPLLRFRWANGRVEKSIHVSINAGGSWVPFAFERNRFPFDVITGIGGTGSEVVIGSRAGLQLSSSGSTGIDTPSLRFTNIGSQTAAALVPVDRVDASYANRDALIIRSGGQCVQRLNGSNGRCPDDLRLWRGEQPGLWRWWRDANDRLRGNYEATAGGNSTTWSVRMNAGRFPHDRLRDFASCGATTYALWRDRNWVTVSNDAEFGLRNSRIEEFDNRLRALFCLPQASAIIARTDNGYINLSGNSMPSVPADELKRYDAQQIKLAHGDLRILDDEQGPRFQHTANGAWQDLNWSQHRLAVDQRRSLLSVDNRLWSATDDGVLLLDSSATGDVSVDPTSFRLLPLPDAECLVTDMLAEPSPNGNAVVRCNDDTSRVYDGTLAASGNVGGWQARSDDPFVEPDQVREPNLALGVQLVGHEGGDDGNLNIVLRDEPVELENGRFNFDDVVKVVQRGPSRIELVTLAGWFRTPANDVSLGAWQRPGVGAAQQVFDMVRTTQADDGGARVCIDSPEEGPRVLDQQDRLIDEPGECIRYFGADVLWTYSAIAQSVQVSGADLRSRPMERTLADGRFQTDVARGVPVIGKIDDISRLYVPTEDGVAVLNRDKSIHGYYSGPFNGLSDGTAPKRLVTEDDSVFYVGDQLYALADGRPAANSDWVPSSSAVGTVVQQQDDRVLAMEWSDAGFDWQQHVSGALLPPNYYQVAPGELGNPEGNDPALIIGVANSQLFAFVTGRKPHVLASRRFEPLSLWFADQQLLVAQADGVSQIALDQLAELARSEPELQSEEIVRAIQQALIASGFDPGPVNGVAGELTLKGIAAYRSENGVAGSGLDVYLYVALIIEGEAGEI